MKNMMMILAACLILTVSSSALSRTVTLTMETCYRSAVLAWLEENIEGTSMQREHMRVEGWFEPRFDTELYSVDIGDANVFYLHVSFLDHGVSRMPFTANDATFCVNVKRDSFMTRRELPLPHVEFIRFESIHYIVDTEGVSHEISESHNLQLNESCPNSTELDKLANFQQMLTEEENMTVDICKF